MVATFALIYTGGLTLNLMTLGGLALGVGMMVDSSIVVVENIYRRKEELGEAVEVAAVEGTREVSGAVIASTITTLVIFLPLLFVRGVSGLLFGELALVVAFSLLCALAVALSLVPMMASRILTNAGSARGSTSGSTLGSRLARGANAVVTRLGGAYESLLEGALVRKGTTMVLAIGSVIVSVFLLSFIGTEFMPPSDEGQVEVVAEMEVGTRLGLVDEQSRLMEAIVVEEVPEMVSSVVTVGAGGFRGADVPRGSMQLSLSPATKRKRSNSQIPDDLRRKLEGQIAGAQIRVRAPQGQFLLERLLGGTADSLMIEVRGYEFEVLGALAREAERVLLTVPGVTDVQVGRVEGVPEDTVRIDRAKAAQLGLTPRDIAEVLEIAVAGRQAGEFRPQGESYRILLQLADAQQLSIDDILDMTLQTSGGHVVALRNLVSIDSGRGPMRINRKDQQRIVEVAANISGRDMGSVAADARLALVDIPRPAGYDLLIAGNFEEQEQASRELVLSLFLAVVLVYMVLACQYESLRDPLIVMLSVPVAGFGVVITLFLTHTTLNVQSYIGCIMLAGIVVNNAILLVDQAGQLRGQGLSVHRAVVEAGRRRLRPILMTSLTTILGLLPLAFGVGEGAEAQAPPGRAVIGGLTGSTLITLVLIPVVYTMVHRDSSVAGVAGVSGAK